MVAALRILQEWAVSVDETELLRISFLAGAFQAHYQIYGWLQTGR